MLVNLYHLKHDLEIFMQIFQIKKINYSSSGNTYYSKSGSKLIINKTEHGDSRTNFIN